ncbi:hypothetical protein OCU04_004878 [Sclerotinia nivalis]|uniref:Uncharacterized protein n=1 Tax=Sclerotinia nivalis TaxID=352851 RepID=A0A9X0ARC9_9HELO|nr:hypothetical protein OCU04_004878 [Sclerotinia nivalis]
MVRQRRILNRKLGPKPKPARKSSLEKQARDMNQDEEMQDSGIPAAEQEEAFSASSAPVSHPIKNKDGKMKDRPVPKFRTPEEIAMRAAHQKARPKAYYKRCDARRKLASQLANSEPELEMGLSNLGIGGENEDGDEDGDNEDKDEIEDRLWGLHLDDDECGGGASGKGGMGGMGGSGGSGGSSQGAAQAIMLAAV